MLNKNLVVKIVALCFICSFLTGIVVYASTPTTVLTLSSGPYPSASSYSISLVAGSTYAKDQNGVIVYSGTDADTVMQSVIDDLETSGGEMFISGGPTTIYELDDALELPSVADYSSAFNRIIIRSEGAVLRTTDAIAVFNNGDPSGFVAGVIFKNLVLDGDATGTVGFNVTNMVHCVSYDCVATDFTDAGLVLVSTGSGLFANENEFYNFMGSYNGNDGIRIGDGDGNEASGNIFLNPYLHNNDRYGLYIRTPWNVFYGGDISNNDINIMFNGVGAPTYTIAEQNRLYSIYSEASDSGPEIYFGEWSRLNQLYGVTTVDIVAEMSSATYVQYFYGGKLGTVGGITGSKASSIKAYSLNSWITENSGITGALGTGMVISHGLDGTPTAVLVTPTDTGLSDIYVSSVNALNFTINFAGGGGHTFYWRASYDPPAY